MTGLTITHWGRLQGSRSRRLIWRDQVTNTADSKGKARSRRLTRRERVTESDWGKQNTTIDLGKTAWRLTWGKEGTTVDLGKRGHDDWLGENRTRWLTWGKEGTTIDLGKTGHDWLGLTWAGWNCPRRLTSPPSDDCDDAYSQTNNRHRPCGCHDLFCFWLFVCLFLTWKGTGHAIPFEDRPQSPKLALLPRHVHGGTERPGERHCHLEPTTAGWTLQRRRTCDHSLVTAYKVWPADQRHQAEPSRDTGLVITLSSRQIRSDQ